MSLKYSLKLDWLLASSKLPPMKCHIFKSFESYEISVSKPCVDSFAYKQVFFPFHYISTKRLNCITEIKHAMTAFSSTFHLYHSLSRFNIFRGPMILRYFTISIRFKIRWSDVSQLLIFCKYLVYCCFHVYE